MADIFNQVGFHDGTMVSYHQTQMAKEESLGIDITAPDSIDTEAYKSYIDGIELLQYDILYGDRFCYKGENKYPPTDIVMGIDDIIITDMYTSSYNEEHICVIGEGFTKWSRVYVNGNKVSTKYVSGNEIIFKDSFLDEGDIIVVNQVGSKSTIFRSSNEWTYVYAPFPGEDDTESTESTETSEEDNSNDEEITSDENQ